ncbi:hypothetical protein BH10ACT5_BH10ACT5_00340 [soil metagenome]
MFPGIAELSGRSGARQQASVLGRRYCRAVLHDPLEIAAFTGSGEPRLVFARLDDDAIVYMPDGDAVAFKERRRIGETFRCVVPDCERPILTVVNRRGKKRDGFSHGKGAGNHGMGLSHLQSQLLVAGWLRTKYPGLRVELEETTEDGRRRADVMATALRSGKKIAFEVQYAAMTAEEWTARHESYRDLGIVDVWLFGHTGDQLRKGADVGSVALNYAQRAVAAVGLPVLWINPELGLIAHATVNSYSEELPGARVLANNWFGQLAIEPIDQFFLTAERQFISKSIRALIRTAERIAEAAEQKRRETEDRERQRQARNDRFIKRMESKRNESAKAHSGTALDARVREEFGSYPVWLTHTPTYSKGVIHLPIPPVLWQSRLYFNYIHAKPDGHRLSVLAMQRELEAMDPDVRLSEEAIRSWLSLLALNQVIREQRRRGDLWTKYQVGAARAETVPVAPPTYLSVRELRERGAIVPTNARMSNGLTACVVCRSWLKARESIRLGYHVGCAAQLAARLEMNNIQEPGTELSTPAGPLSILKEIEPTEPIGRSPNVERKMRPPQQKQIWMDADGHLRVTTLPSAPSAAAGGFPECDVEEFEL